MPTTLERARSSDVEAIGEALILQLVGAATLRVEVTSMRAPLAAVRLEDTDSLTRHNIAQVRHCTPNHSPGPSPSTAALAPPKAYSVAQHAVASLPTRQSVH